jgi:hypothetical protein
MKHNKELAFSSSLYSEQYIHKLLKKENYSIRSKIYEDLLEVISLDSERI